MGLCAVPASGCHRRSQASLEDHDMDGSRFDALARALHEVRSRRGAFASLLGGTVGLLGLAETTAKKKKKKKKNKCTLLRGQVCGGACCFALEGEKCCDGACIP